MNRDKRKQVLKKKLIKQRKKQTKIAFKIRDINRELWQLEMDDVRYLNWFNQLDWRYKGYKGCFEAYEIVSRQNAKNEIVKKMINWYYDNKDDEEDYLRLYKKDTTMVAMTLDYDHDDNESSTISIFAIDFNASYVESELISKKLLKDFAEKFNINNIEKW